MRIERKIVLSLTEEEDNLFTDFLDMLDKMVCLMDNENMDLDADTADILMNLKNAYSYLDRAYSDIDGMRD